MKLVGKTYHIAAGTAVVGVIFALGVFLPHARRYARLESQVHAAELAVDAASDRLDTLAETHRRVEEDQELLKIFNEAVPNEDHMGAFLESVDRIAAEQGLADMNVVPRPPIVADAVRCRPIEMSFRGDFNAVYAFVRQVESLPRIAAIQRLELDAAKELDGGLIASLTVHVYSRRS